MISIVRIFRHVFFPSDLFRISDWQKVRRYQAALVRNQRSVIKLHNVTEAIVEQLRQHE